MQRPPYHLVGSSLGSQVDPDLCDRAFRRMVSKLVLICPSGFHGDENLPMIEGVRRSNYESLVKSVFHRDHFASDELVQALARKFQDRHWKKGVLKTLRATVGHSVGIAPGAGSAADPGDLGSQRSRPLRRARCDPRGRAHSSGPAGRHTEVRPRPADREVTAGQPPDLAVPARQAQDNSTGARAVPIL